MHRIEATLSRRISDGNAVLAQKISNVEKGLQDRMHANNLTTLRWMIGLWVTLAALIVSLSKLVK